MSENGNRNVSAYRYEMGASILRQMKTNGELPLPNVQRLTKAMMTHYRQDGFEADIVEHGYKWRPTELYWQNQLADVRGWLRKDEEYFEYVRDFQDDWKGEWKFASKEEYKANLMLEHADIGTRTEHHNAKIDDGMKRWALDLPHIEPVPLLTADHGK